MAESVTLSYSCSASLLECFWCSKGLRTLLLTAQRFLSDTLIKKCARQDESFPPKEQSEEKHWVAKVLIARLVFYDSIFCWEILEGNVWCPILRFSLSNEKLLSVRAMDFWLHSHCWFCAYFLESCVVDTFACLLRELSCRYDIGRLLDWSEG